MTLGTYTDLDNIGFRNLGLIQVQAWILLGL